MRVYRVTATHEHSPVVGDKPARTELAKFFEESHATKFVKNVAGQPDGWREIRIETAEESLEQQHHAHGGKVGK